MLAKVTETTAGKIVLVVAVVALVGAAGFVGFRSMGDQGQTADPQEVKASAQKQVDVIKNNPNLPPALKAQMLAQYEAQARGGTAPGAGRSGPPKGDGGG